MKCNYKPEALDVNYKLTSKQLETIMAQTPNRYDKGELVYLTDLEKVQMYNGEAWMDLPSSAKINNESSLGMSLYDLNKSAMAQFPPMEDFSYAISLINCFQIDNNYKYLMLLCKEISYYTIFMKDSKDWETMDLGNSVIECLLNVGHVLSVDLTEAQDAIEIWVRTNDNENICMYLFNCIDLIVRFD